MNCIKKAVAVMLSILLVFTLNTSVGLNAVAAEDTVYIGIKGEINYDYAVEVVEILNELRAELGIEPLGMDYTLTGDAMLRAAETSIYFSHTRPNGENCYSAFTDFVWTAGENIAVGQKSPSEVMQDWENSPGHYRNMIDEDFTSVGIGCYESSNGYLCWVQLFSGNEAKEKTVGGTEEKSYTIEAKPENLDLRLSVGNKPCSLKKGENFKLKLTNYNVEFPYATQEIEASSLSFTSSDKGVIGFLSDGTATIKGEGVSDLAVVAKNGGARLWTTQYDSGHIFTDCCDISCDLCSGNRTAPHSCAPTPCDEDKVCSLCGITLGSGSAHKYSGAGDALCDVCGFERALIYILGDADGDQTVTTGDLAALKLYLAGSRQLEAVSKTLSDLNDDAFVDTTDLAKLKLYLAGVVELQ